ncbi:uncharacterized protein TNCV_994441 [Trichonephila clavipes]|nr:uncharacterized protein TNCV_994441 [Trichonephila clavipes]
MDTALAPPLLMLHVAVKTGHIPASVRLWEDKMNGTLYAGSLGQTLRRDRGDMTKFPIFIAIHGRKRLRSALGGIVHKNIQGNRPALSQSFKLSSPAEIYTRAFGDGPRHLNHGQVTWKTPELAPPLLTTTPHQREDVSALDRFNVHRCPTRRVFSGTEFVSGGNVPPIRVWRQRG